MKTSPPSTPPRRCQHVSSLVLAGMLSFSPTFLFAQGARPNPASKMYVTEVNGGATIDTGEVIDDLTKRSVYNAQGTVVETNKPESPSDQAKYSSTMVYSNGTGAYFDADTRVEVKRFMQEPFTPNRTDMDVEPSISQTQAYVSRGLVGLCTSKLVAGSRMTYATPQGSVNIRGRKLVIEAGDQMTKVSMLEGESTITAGAMDTGGHTLKVGEQAIIRRGAPGQPNQIEIRPIPQEERAELDDKVAMACMARKTVYFEVREKKVDTLQPGSLASLDDAAAGATTGGAFSPVTAFDATTGSGNNLNSSSTTREIVPVQIISPTLPVEFTVSTASITPTPGR